MASERGPILAPLDKAHLASQGLVSPSGQDGMVKLHRRRTYRSSDVEYDNIPLDVHALAASGIDEVFVEIPEMVISKATLLYVGFTPMKAEQLWQRWVDWPADGPRREVDEDDGGLVVTFKDIITGHIGRKGGGLLDTDSDNDDEWYQCLESYGLSQDTQDRIMDPLFAYIRQNQTCAFWARDTVEMRLAGLEEIQLASLEREAKLQQTGAGPEPSPTSASGQAGLRVVPGSTPFPGSPGASQSSRARPSSPGKAKAPADSTRSAIETAARNAPGHTLLFRSLDAARTRSLFDESGRVQSFHLLASSPPTDFNEFQSAFYFTPQYAVAEYYAAYAKKRANCEGVVIVAIAVPNMAIEALKPPAIQRLYWSKDWADMIWHCRQGRPVPPPLRKYRQSVLTIGHIARSPNSKYRRIQSPRQISQRNLLLVEGPGGRTKAVQYVFSNNDETRDWLWENGAQTAKEFAFTGQDLEAWVRENRVRGVA